MDTRTRRNLGSTYSEEQIKRVLAGAGIAIQGEVDTDYLIYCPFHPNNRTPAGEIDKNNGTFFCFSCHHVASLVEVIMHTTSRTYFEAIRFVKSRETAVDIQQDIAKQLISKPDFVEFDRATVERLAQDAASSERAVGYFAGRKISKESMSRFQLGYSAKQDMVTVPVHAPDGMLVGFVGRSVEGKEFKNTPGLPKAKTLFNIHRVKTATAVYVVESSFDAIRLDQCGLPAVATLGSNVSNIQIDLLKKYFNNIYVIADNDEAGTNMLNRITDKAGSRVMSIQLNKQYKDIGDMPDDEIKKLEVSFDKHIVSMLK